MRRPALWYFSRRWFPAAPKGPWLLPADPAGMDVFLLMGQSNMAGFGCIRADDPWQAGDWEPVPGVLVLGGQGTVKSPRPRGRLRWRPAEHPLHLNQQSAGFGLGLEFARCLRDRHPDRLVGLVPCAWGGAPIERLEAGSPLYANSLRRALLARQSGRLRAVLWHQGESDAGTDERATGHADRLGRLMAHLRLDLGTPELPFLIGDLAPFTEASRQENVRSAAGRTALVRSGLRAVADTDPHAAFIPSEGLTGVDAVHFGRRALVEFGRRYAEAWQRLSG